MKFNKAAMFGLDARIALAIFGALSVISGAALYSAIQQSKIVSLNARVAEVTKALEQYYLDTGELPVTYNNYALDSEALIVKPSGLNTWNGPYIAMQEHASSSRLVDGDNVEFIFNMLKTDTWSADSDRICRKTTASCHVFLCVLNASATKEELENYFDGNASPVAADYYSGEYRNASGCQFIKTSIPFDPANAPSS